MIFRGSSLRAQSSGWDFSNADTNLASDGGGTDGSGDRLGDFRAGSGTASAAGAAANGPRPGGPPRAGAVARTSVPVLSGYRSGRSTLVAQPNSAERGAIQTYRRINGKVGERVTDDHGWP